MLVVLKEYLSDYNAVSKKPMQLVLFQFALEHVSRICRIITSPGTAFAVFWVPKQVPFVPAGSFSSSHTLLVRCSVWRTQRAKRVLVTPKQAMLTVHN